MTAEGRAHPRLVTRLWHWRWELGCVILAAGIEAFSATVGRRWAPLVVPACLLILLLDPTGRSAFLRRSRAVIDQHRLRAAFGATGTWSTSGRTPTILWTTITPAGERIWLWCPIGVDRGVLESLTGTFAAACWASSVRVTSRGRHSQLLALDITHRTGASVTVAHLKLGRSPDSSVGQDALPAESTLLLERIDATTEIPHRATFTKEHRTCRSGTSSGSSSSVSRSSPT